MVGGGWGCGKGMEKGEGIFSLYKVKIHPSALRPFPTTTTIPPTHTIPSSPPPHPAIPPHPTHSTTPTHPNHPHPTNPTPTNAQALLTGLRCYGTPDQEGKGASTGVLYRRVTHQRAGAFLEMFLVKLVV